MFISLPSSGTGPGPCALEDACQFLVASTASRYRASSHNPPCVSDRQGPECSQILPQRLCCFLAHWVVVGNVAQRVDRSSGSVCPGLAGQRAHPASNRVVYQGRPNMPNPQPSHNGTVLRGLIVDSGGNCAQNPVDHRAGKCNSPRRIRAQQSVTLCLGSAGMACSAQRRRMAAVLSSVTIQNDCAAEPLLDGQWLSSDAPSMKWTAQCSPSSKQPITRGDAGGPNLVIAQRYCGAVRRTARIHRAATEVVAGNRPCGRQVPGVVHRRVSAETLCTRGELGMRYAAAH